MGRGRGTRLNKHKESKMRPSPQRPGAWASRAVSLTLGLLLCAPAMAKVTLPDGTVVPKPAIGCYGGKPGGLNAIFACVCKTKGVCNIGPHCNTGSSCPKPQNGVCESTIWHAVNDDPCIPKLIDKSGLVPVRDAATKPETFRPVCGLTFSLVTRGGAMFKNGFGWYNVVPGKKPDAKDLHLLIDCHTKAGTKTAFTLLNNTHYKGGNIGFFLVTPEDKNKKGSCAGGDCCATLARAAKGEGRLYYSEPKHNPDNKGAGSYIHLLIYNSKIFHHTFYFAWEDTYDGTTTDYSDFVTSVSGLSCSGAGLKCSISSNKGICQLGVTKCDSDGNLTCKSIFTGEAERCDGLDNDCDGKPDDGATCPAGKICYKGACMPRCSASSEFACQSGYECDTTLGYCVDKKCKTVTCPKDQICRLGKCGNGCNGVVCPRDQICQGGICLDPCAGRNCKQGEICKHGVCLPDCTQCGGVTCVSPLLCDSTTGDCYDPACKPRCKAGTYCLNGTCVGDCHGVKCPGNMKCDKGQCPPPGFGKKAPLVDGSTGHLDGSGSDDGGGPIRVDRGTGGNKAFYVDEGCSCSLKTTAGGGDLPLAGVFYLLLLGLVTLARHRR